MTKEEIEKLKQNPKRYKRYLKSCRKYGKRKRQRKRKERLERRSKSPYYQVKGYQRYKRHKFCLMARSANYRCGGKITALDLWSIAKKQKLICPLTGEKLTCKNISVDHIMPISKDGANTPSNIQLITNHANTIKNNMNLAELLHLCQAIVQRLAPIVSG
jgi:5-methylcytosine-specific restriction endonuclease McrA